MQVVDELPIKGESLVVPVFIGESAARLVPVTIGDQLQDSKLRSLDYGEQIAYNFMSVVDNAFVSMVGSVLIVQFVKRPHGYWVTTASP